MSNDIIVVPPEFALLFILPILAFIFTLRRDHELSLAVFVYLILQITLAVSARYIYG
jgi:hypothetical protein